MTFHIRRSESQGRRAAAATALTKGALLGIIVLLGPACGGGGGGAGAGGTGGSPGFDGNGSLIEDVTSGSEGANAIASDGLSLFIAGYQRTTGGSDSAWRVEKRSLPDGALVSAFGSGGAVEVNPSGANDSALALALDATSLYIAGTQLDPLSGTQSIIRIEKRSLTTGALDAGFGTAGVLTANPSAGTDYARSVILDSANLYVFGADQTPGSNTGWRVEKRAASDGALVASFGTGGVVQINPSSLSLEEAASGVVAGSFVYFTGADFGFGARWHLEQHSK